MNDEPASPPESPHFGPEVFDKKEEHVFRNYMWKVIGGSTLGAIALGVLGFRLSAATKKTSYKVLGTTSGIIGGWCVGEWISLAILRRQPEVAKIGEKIRHNVELVVAHEEKHLEDEKKKV
eukprot:TRINITY_DN43_c0_g1_i1.p1 TRINITY_DN43_c0_g1~~TRINITY_DN43_c0_g1_i1.p1  ORF type:complete len:121 (-),score=19.62 TRINITY_DN43_c0_g1_i1:161-523(-)